MTVNEFEDDIVNYPVKAGIPITGADIFRKKGLLDCPLCGNEALFVKYHDGYFVKCSCCDCMVALQISISTEDILPFETMEKASKAWNRRSGSTREANMINAKIEPELILKRREWRSDLIADSIKKEGGDTILVEDISSDTGIAVTTIKNLMKFVKQRYPEIHSKSGRPGYYWGEEK